MTGCRRWTKGHRFHGSAICGSSEIIGFIAQTAGIPSPSKCCLDRKRRRWSSPIHPITYRSRCNVSGLGRVKHREFAMASGEMSSAEFTRFLAGIFGNLAAFSVEGSIHFVCMDWRHALEILQAGSEAYSELKNLCVWVKDNGGMGTFYRSRHELIFAFKSGDAPHINSFELGQHGRYRTNVWQYRGMNSLSATRHQELGLHPTVKPVTLIADAIKDVSNRSGIVLDCFGGSGSTLIAAHKTGRRARLIEIDPTYVDRMIRRWQVYAKDDAVLATMGQHAAREQTFETVAEERSSGPILPAIKEDVQ
jgi:hypothetical protein